MKEIQVLCIKLPKEEKFILVDQIRRAALSVSNNIAEGASRKSDLDRRRFYVIARSSLVEVDNCLEIAVHCAYTQPEDIKQLELYILEGFKLLSAMVRN